MSALPALAVLRGAAAESPVRHVEFSCLLLLLINNTGSKQPSPPPVPQPRYRHQRARTTAGHRRSKPLGYPPISAILANESNLSILMPPGGRIRWKRGSPRPVHSSPAGRSLPANNSPHTFLALRTMIDFAARLCRFPIDCIGFMGEQTPIGVSIAFATRETAVIPQQASINAP